MSSWVGPSPPHTITASASVERAAQRRDDAGEVVAHLDLEMRVDAGQRELLADPRRVGVDDLPEQQLGADGDDLAAHAHAPSTVPRCAASGRDGRRARYCAAGEHTVSTTATHSNVLPQPARRRAVSGSSAKPTASCWHNVLTLASRLAGTLTPVAPAMLRYTLMTISRAAMISDRQPPEHVAGDQREHRAEHQHLVGQRVEEGARAGGAVPAGQLAVDAVGGAQHEPQDERRPRAVGAGDHHEQQRRREQPRRP